MLETTIPKGMASTMKSLSNIEDTKQLYQLWTTLNGTYNYGSLGATTMKVPDIEDTGQPHQSWYQHMEEGEKTTTIMEGIFMITIMTLINYAVPHLKLKGGRNLTEIALASTLVFHTPINETSYYTYPIYIIFWITWVICRKHKRNPGKTTITRYKYRSNLEPQQESHKTIQLPNLTKVLNENIKLKDEINRTKRLFVKTTSRNAVLNNQTANMETTIKSMENRMRNLKNISINLRGTVEYQLTKHQHIKTELQDTVRRTKQALTQATIELSLKEKTLQRYKITKSRQDEDNHNLQERNN